MKKTKLRRVLALLLTALMMFSLCACGGKNEPVATPAPTPTPMPTPEPTPVPTPEPTPEPIVGEVHTDDDGDGVINYKFNYKGATVYAMIVLDPAFVYVGTAAMEPGGWVNYGLTLDAMAQQYGAIGGINAGGFEDVSGAGTGWPPRGITYSRGQNFNPHQYGPTAGIDNSNVLWTGFYNYDDCEVMGIRDAVCFGPTLIENGVKTDPATYETGIGARTAIGQREDGAIVMVAIDGRQGYSIGVTFEDVANIMADKFGCINASNMDGGNSTCMYFDGQAVNRSANQAGGTRYLPDAWLVNAVPEDYVRPEGVPEYIVLPENALGEVKEYEYECDQETAYRMYDFACAFAYGYYGYFGTRNSDYFYPTLGRHVAQDCELRERMDLALMDRLWVNTWNTEAKNIALVGAYSNGDGSFDIIIESDIYEYSTYWNYEALGTRLIITVVEAPEADYGYLAVSTY